LRVQYTFAAQLWLADLETCAGENLVSPELRSINSFDFSSYDLAIRIGDLNVTTPAYQIDTEEIVVIVHPQNPVSALTTEEVLGLFTGQLASWQSITGTESAVQVWVFSSDEDIQQVFEQTALGSAPVSSLARQASGPGEMTGAVAADVNAIGFLPRQQLTAGVSAVHTVASLPILAITPSAPSPIAEEVIACLQSK